MYRNLLMTDEISWWLYVKHIISLFEDTFITYFPHSSGVEPKTCPWYKTRTTLSVKLLSLAEITVEAPAIRALLVSRLIGSPTNVINVMCTYIANLSTTFPFQE